MSVLLRTDVTSVKLYTDLILAGIGSWFSVFEKSTGNFLQRILCLNGQKIYGIVPRENKFLIFGGKQFTLLRFDDGDESRRLVRVFDVVVCDDWVHSGVWIDENSVAFLTAHNVVEHWTLSPPTLQSRTPHEDNSILYSGLLLPVDNEVLVLAGTVFSQVIVHCQGETLHRLDGHKGVIFSITCHPTDGVIVSTSDDRSVRVWTTIGSTSLNNLEQWKNCVIMCKYTLYGHTARVMRSCITADNIISIGEDSVICFWAKDGKLLKRLTRHQNGCIWSLDADEDSLVTGGGDAGVIIHPLSVAAEYNIQKLQHIDFKNPKILLLTARNNLIIISSKDEMMYYNLDDNYSNTFKLGHKSTCKFADMSSCKQMVAVADMYGKLDVFIENCKGTPTLLNVIDTRLKDGGRVASLHWAGNRHVAVCFDDGTIQVLTASNSQLEVYTEFLLPPCRERWLTSATVNNKKDVFVFGDRVGGIHIYIKGDKNPFVFFNEVHGRYGATSITIRDGEIITTGRSGQIKCHNIIGDTIEFRNTVKYMSKIELDFQWVEKFLDKDLNIICGFKECEFHVYDTKNNLKLLELACGGGHRSWDAVRYFEKINENLEEIIRFVYLKYGDIYLVNFVLSKIASRNILNGSHCKEINCMKIIPVNDTFVTVSGGEDTTLRVTSVDPYEDKFVFKHLSNIKTVKLHNVDSETVLAVTAGGRAQICITAITVAQKDGIKIKSQELINYLIKGIDKIRRNNQDWRKSCIDFDPETRIVDLDIVKIDPGYTIFAGCSDGLIRVFKLRTNFFESQFDFTEEIQYHKTCILKTSCITYLDHQILLICTTKGEISFWNTLNYGKEPFFQMKTNKSGINSLATINIDNKLLISTGGDDNSIHLVLLELKDQNDLTSIQVINSIVLDKCHSSQITGLVLIDKYLLSASIDQRVTLFRWKCDEEIACEFVSQMYSDVADIQGMELVKFTGSTVRVCVFGKVVEVLEMLLPEE